jgi:hypothetical protein
MGIERLMKRRSIRLSRWSLGRRRRTEGTDMDINIRVLTMIILIDY